MLSIVAMLVHQQVENSHRRRECLRDRLSSGLNSDVAEYT